MNIRAQVKLLQEAMIEAIERKVNPLSYFVARDAVFQYADNIVSNKALSPNVGFLPPEVIERLRNASIRADDIRVAKDEHRQNNRVLREAAIFLLGQKKQNGDAITVYEVKDDIAQFLAGKAPAFSDVYNYQALITYHIDKIDMAHVFEDCHNDAVHAMITILNVPPADAYHEVILVANHELAQYPRLAKEAKELVKKEATNFIKTSGGLVVSAEQHIQYLTTNQNIEGLTEDQLHIANMPALFTKYLFTDEFKNELADVAMATYLNAPGPAAKSALFTNAAPLPSPVNLTRNNIPGAVKTINPDIVLIAAPNNNPIVSSSFLLTAYNHVGSNKEAYVLAGLLFLGIMYCTGKLKNLNPLPSIRGFFGNQKASIYKKILTGYDKVGSGSDSDPDDVEAQEKPEYFTGKRGDDLGKKIVCRR